MGIKVTNEAITSAYHEQQALPRVTVEKMLEAAAPHMRRVIAPVDVYQVLKRWSDNGSLDLVHIGAISRDVAALEGSTIPVNVDHSLKITDGDWNIGSKIYFEGRPSGFNIAGEDGYHIAKVSTRSSMNNQDGHGGENLANALAIAAIPRMAAFIQLIAESNSSFSNEAAHILSGMNPDTYVHPDDEDEGIAF